jgi:hypothetical protein
MLARGKQLNRSANKVVVGRTGCFERPELEGLRGRAAALFPHPFSASGIFPPLRVGQVSLVEAGAVLVTESAITYSPGISTWCCERILSPQRRHTISAPAIVLSNPSCSRMYCGASCDIAMRPPQPACLLTSVTIRIVSILNPHYRSSINRCADEPVMHARRRC